MSFDKWTEEKVFDIELEKRKFIDHLNTLHAMSVEEQTLYKKWYEITTKYKEWFNRAGVYKAKIWRPSDITNLDLTIQELSNLKPVLRFIEPSNRIGIDEWETYRIFVSSFNFDQSPGRFIRFVLEDEVTGKILGVTSLASDVMSIGVRDKYIGWTEDDRSGGMLNHTCIGSTIIATQPFGFNFLGGKLLAAMLTTSAISGKWKGLYGETLVGITTTSLYGNGSMYNSIPWWKSLGHSQGKIPLKPDDHFYKIWHEIIKTKYPEEYEELSYNDDRVVATGVKSKIINVIFREVGIKASSYVHGFERGVYFAPLYENTNQFLKKEITESALVPLKRGTSMNDVMKWWVPKAIKRYTDLHSTNKLKPEVLFYNKMIGMSWSEAKQTYLSEVGR